MFYIEHLGKNGLKEARLQLPFSCDGIYIVIFYLLARYCYYLYKGLTRATPPFSYIRTVAGHVRVKVAWPNHLKQEALKGMLEYCIALYNDLGPDYMANFSSLRGTEISIRVC